MLLSAMVVFYIDGPAVLPRANEEVEVDANFTACVSHFCSVLKVPRVVWAMTLLNLWFALGTVHIEFFSKFGKDEFDWSYETTAFLTAPIFIVAGVVGKYIGAKVIDHR